MFDAIYQYLSSLSSLYGSGDTTADVVGVTLVVSFVALMIGLISYRRERSVENEMPSVERIHGMNGKLEKIERTVNEFRTEMMRQGELTRGSLEFAKEELTQIRDSLYELIGRTPVRGGSSTPSSSTPGSSSSSGSGGGTPVPSKSASSVAAPSSPSLSYASPTTEITAQEVKTLFEGIDGSSPVAEGEKDSNDTSIFGRLRRSRENILGRVKGFFTGKPQLDQAMVDQLEEVLISSDIGVKTSMAIIEHLKEQVTRGEKVTEEGLFELLKGRLIKVLTNAGADRSEIVPLKMADGPFVVMLVGVNGAGKTTTVAKLAHQWREKGKTVMVAAADTFRAAAVDQLKEWADRIQVPVISGAEGAKPATVVYDAMVAAQRDKIDILIIDTAGRLQNKSNLMQELEGVNNVMTKHQPSAPHEVLLVVDGSSGQNALNQAREFNSAVSLTGIVITKLDGTPKGGMVVAIKSELGIPVRYIGVGEKREDLRIFEAREFVDALVGSADAKDLDMTLAASVGPRDPSLSTSIH